MLQVVETVGQNTQGHPILGQPEKLKTAKKPAMPADRWERIQRKRLCCKTCAGKGCTGHCRF